MRPHIGLLPQCLFIVRSRAKVNKREESYVSRAEKVFFVRRQAPANAAHPQA